jgi:hypothetical protein
MTSTIHKILTKTGTTTALLAAFSMVLAAQQPMPKTTTERIAGAPTVTTKETKGTVVAVDDNDLLVRMSNGELDNFIVPSSRKFLIDGKELSVSELKPGTKLTATVTTTTTPVTQRTTTIGSGTVWYVAGNTVIVTLPDHTNKMYTVNDSYKFNVNGKQSGVHELRKGMRISAEKIEESPTTEMSSSTVVTGTAPPAPKPVVADAQPSKMAAPPPAAAPRPRPAAAAPAQVADATPPPSAAPKPTALPKTASDVPLAGLLGLLSVGVGLGLRRLRLS